MSEFGISPEGFKTKRLDQLLEELNGAVKAVLGENLNVSPESPDGQINGIVSESNANLWEIAEESYNAFNPSAATGDSLSNLVQLNGITRLAATSSRVQLSLTGTAGTIIPVGSLISTSDTAEQFSTEVSVTLDGVGNGSVFANSVQTGPVQALAGTLTEIDTPIAGWSSVTNSADAQVGTEEETDVELRARREQSVARDAQNNVDSIFAEISAVEGVTRVVVLENDTDSVDSNGLDPHSILAIVVGGIDEDIAQAIYLKKPGGIPANGNVTVQIVDSQGIPKDISFSRPTEIDIYVTVDITTFPEYPANGDDLIKQAIVDYANGDLIVGRGFSLADDVIQSRLYTAVNSVQGHDIDEIYIDTSPNPTSTANIPIAVDEISNFTVANITVNQI